MEAITTIGLDIAKSVFQVHGVDAAGNVRCPSATEAPECSGVLSEDAVVPGRDRGLRYIAPLVARDDGTWPHRAADAAGLREALREAAEERRGRCRGDPIQA